VALAPYNADARNLELVYRLEVFSRDIFQSGKWRACVGCLPPDDRGRENQ
jgi:hypothetical protein